MQFMNSIFYARFKLFWKTKEEEKMEKIVSFRLL